MYNAYITRIKNVRKHPNADRLQLGECFGNTVVVSLDYEDNQIGIYFPSDGQLSVEFAEANNLLRKKDDAGNNIGGYMDPDKRNVTAIRLRGEKSDGLFLPLKSLESFGDIADLAEGMKIDTFNGHLICQKYIPRTQNRRGHYSEGNKTRKKKTKVPVSPLFSEHVDTEQLAYNLGAFKPGDEVEITLKLHGTSQRTANLPVLKGYADSYGCRAANAIRRFLKKMGCYHGEDAHDGEPIYDCDYVTGTRRVVLEGYDGGFYGSNEFREQHAKVFEGKLYRGETVYYEVVGFTHAGAPIMASADNKKVNDKEFIKQYGKETVFSYGCEPNGVKFVNTAAEQVANQLNNHPCTNDKLLPQSDIYVYRMTITNSEGFVVEYSPDFMRYRCEQMGVKTVPVLWKGTIPNCEAELGMVHDHDQTPINPGEWIKNVAERYYEGPDPIGKTHIREGVVVRILNRPKFAAYKHKNFHFKVLEGLIKDSASAPDMEEAQDISETTQND